MLKIILIKKLTINRFEKKKFIPLTTRPLFLYEKTPQDRK